ncbi:restriction endonuclease subunit S [Cecembia lonarensis]|uniref:EcoKI restriction-modification system protein HsdS n=1 Tax=Cecembia lonarensis (strain CCUG 58316 / KCTC 22772 / LW9) TaxID=1225176 RepID=K1L7N4_CECL9|nr:restriction endonuclease subunit S [Cecembia lonarensis]EKB48132.1 EcoKI restriction-modification system protein HsdS [Cecembia lonarensis LW9]
MKQVWEIKKLGEVCKVIAGQSPEGKFYNSEGNGMPFYQGKKEYGEKYIGEPTTWTTKITKEAEAGDILMSVRAPVGPVNFATQIICIGRGLAAIRAGKQIDKEFLYNFLIKHENEIEGNAGAVFNSINKTQIENIEIPLPPLPEQQRIVSILDEAFAAIAKAKANAEQNLKNAKELFESYLQGVFENGNWETKTLKEVAKVFGRGKSKHRPRNWEGLYGGDYPFIQTGEVRNANKFITEYTQTYNEVGLAQSKLWKKGTICITIAANIAETAILNFDACIPDSIIGFEVDEKKADLNFAYYLLQYFKAELQKLGKGSAQDNINLGTFENQYFPFPTLKEQQTIVRQLDALRAETQKLEAVYQKKIADLEELKKSILQRAFKGDLTRKEVEV